MSSESLARDARAGSIDWLGKLNHLLQTVAFCLAVSALQVNFVRSQPYIVPTVYSLAIGGLMWACIDFGRHLFPSAADTGWPQGLGGVLLPAGSILIGFFGGTSIADWCFGVSSWDQTYRSQLPISIGITAVAGVVGTYYFYSRNRQAWLEGRVAEVRRQASEAQLKLLEAQLEPHMLFNTLANLRALIGVDPAAAQDMLDRLIAFLRATLAASRTASHPLSAEFARLADYLELMAVRMGPRMAYGLHLPAALESVQVPTLLLQPLVENAIRHGPEPKVAGGRIDVTAARQEGRLVLTVTDTGVGLQNGAEPADARGSGSGFGLAQVRERLATLHGEAAHTEIGASPEGGCRVILRIPLDAA